MNQSFDQERKTTDGIRKRRKISAEDYFLVPGRKKEDQEEKKLDSVFIEKNDEIIDQEETTVPWEEKEVIIEPLFSKPPKRHEFYAKSKYKLLKIANFLPSFNRFTRWGLGVVFFIVLLFLFLLSTIFARVTITITPKEENAALTGDINLALDTSISRPSGLVVPAQLFKFSQDATKDYETTGKEYIQEKARGKVTVYNQFSSFPQTIVQGTRFFTDKGVLYRLTKTIMIPGAKIEAGKIIPQGIEAELVADQVGDSFNTGGEMRLSIPGFKGTPKYEGFYAVASSGFSGGFVGEARVVSADDLKKAEEELTKEVYDTLKKDILRKIPSGFKFVEELSEIPFNEIKINAPKEKTKTDRFTISVSWVGRALAFREDDLAIVLKTLILKNDSTHVFGSQPLNLQYQVQNTDLKNGKAVITLRGNIKIKSVIPQDEIAGILRDNKRGSIIEILKSRPEISLFSVDFFPPWIFTAPSDQSKIRFNIRP